MADDVFSAMHDDQCAHCNGLVATLESHLEDHHGTYAPGDSIAIELYLANDTHTADVEIGDNDD